LGEVRKVFTQKAQGSQPLAGLERDESSSICVPQPNYASTTIYSGEAEGKGKMNSVQWL
jgi:hypothetical protein